MQTNTICSSFLFNFRLKYLSLAKCSRITDSSLIYLTEKGFFSHIKYLNLRECVLVTDKFVKRFAAANLLKKLQLKYSTKCQCEFEWKQIIKSELKASTMPLHLKTLDLSKCSITDKSIEYLSRLISVNPLNILQRLYVSGCDKITDSGIRILALNCKNLRYLNVKQCNMITAKSLKTIKLNCNGCIIQHTNFSFC